MKLVPIKVKGIYGRPGTLLPGSMARLTPDTAASLSIVEAEIAARGGYFRLSDAYRSSAMQARAHDDYIKGRKLAYSPPAGSSMHEAGRAIDLDLAALIHPPSVPRGSQTLNELEVRAVFESHGWTFIAPAGHPHRVDVKESWHVEFRGPFQTVYDTVLRKTGSRARAYQSMAHAAIAALGEGDKEEKAAGSGMGQPKKAIQEEIQDVAANGAGQISETADAMVAQGNQRGAASEVVTASEGGPARVVADASVGAPSITERLKSSTTFMQSLGIQVSAVLTAVWAFLSANRVRLLYILAGSAIVSLICYAIYTWKEVETKRIEAGKR